LNVRSDALRGRQAALNGAALEEQIVERWVGPGCLEIHVLADAQAAEAYARDLPDLLGRVREAAALAHDSDVAKKAQRLQTDLARAKAEREACRARAAQATVAAKAALEAGTDSAGYEKQIREARAEAETLELRVSTLVPLLEAARAQARATVKAAARGAWRECVAELERLWLDNKARLLAAIRPLVSERYALDALSRRLFDGRADEVPAALLNGHSE
jgi:hypothetical protein